MSLLKVIDIHLYPSPSLLPITSPSTPSPYISPQSYSAYIIVPSLLLPFYSRSLYVIVVDPESHWLYALLSLSLQNIFASSSLYHSAFVSCWWDLRRDSSFSYLCIILVLGVFQGLCGVWIINVPCMPAILCELRALVAWLTILETRAAANLALLPLPHPQLPKTARNLISPPQPLLLTIGYQREKKEVRGERGRIRGQGVHLTPGEPQDTKHEGANGPTAPGQ
jgi:hypothetical protein